MRTLLLILAALTLAACSQADADILAPQSSATGQAPSPVPQPIPTPATPALSVRVVQLINGNPVFSGPQDAWHAILEYDYEPDPLRPCLVVKTYYLWDGVFRQNIKVWDCSAGRRVIVDDFYDYAWSVQVTEYSIQVFAASVTNGDWFNGFCMGDVSDYWGCVDPNWLYCPIDGAHPNGLRVASATVTGMSGLPTKSLLVRVLGYSQVTVQ